MSQNPQDEKAVRALYQKLLNAWASGDATHYANLFSEDADYIVATGFHERGRSEIIAAHQQLFDTWAKDSHLFGEICSIRFIAHDIVILVANGAILLPGQSVPDEDEMTIYTLVAKKVDGQWCFVTYQNTPVQADAQ